MRPYLAIIKDSFREALASRVLWVLLVLITLLLVVLTPFHWKSTVAAEMRPQDIRNIRNISNVLKSGAENDASPLSKHIWNSLSESTRKDVSNLQDRSGPRAFRTREQIAKDFNKAIGRDDFFQEALWADAKLSPRAMELRETKKNLSDDSLKQFNRLALEAALPGQLRPCPDEAMMFRYAKWDIDFVPPFRRKMAVELIDTFVLVFMGLFVGVFGIFAAILVTAPIIPNMLDSGSLYVLLSKPISRPLLFVAKFLGGCSFVLINAAYLIAGLCLILGLRFGVWKPQMLWSIPIFLFTFAIFYSVSALSGLYWRSTVIAIVATMLFWFFCKTVGSSKDLLEQLVIVPRKIDNVVQREDEIFVTRKNGTVSHWNPATSSLDEVFAASTEDGGRGPDMIMGPRSSIVNMIYDKDNEQLVALDRKWSKSNIITGSRIGGWRRESVQPAPQNARGMFLHKGELIAIADGGVYQVTTNVEAEKAEDPGGINIFGLKFGQPPPKELHQNISEGVGNLPGDARIAFDDTRGDIYIHGGQKLQKISQQDDVFREVGSADIELEEVTDLAANGGIVALSNREETTVQIQIVDSEKMHVTRTIDAKNDNDVRQLQVSGDGRYVACLFENDELTVFDLANERDDGITSVPGQGGIASAQFTPNGILITDGNDRVRTVSMPELKTLNVLNPKLPFIHQLYRYLIRPIYLVCPKPAELQNTMQYAITGKESVKVEGPGFGPNGRTIKLKPWQPLISNSLFIGAMLLIGCIYVYRQDF